MKIHTLTLALMSLLAAIAWAATNSPPAAPPAETVIRDSYHASYRYEKTQNYADAIKALSPVFTAYPNGYTVNLRLGWLHYLGGHYANSRAHYLAAIKVEPGAIEAKLGYTLPLLAQERYEEAETVCRQILSLDPSNYYASLRLAYSLRLRAKADQAGEVLNRALALYPTDVSLLSELGLVRIAQGRTEDAKSIFLDVSTLDPENILAKAQLTLLASHEMTNSPPSR